MKVHADGPDGLIVSIVRDGDSWEFRADADQPTRDKPGFPESVAMLVQIGDHVSKQYDVKGWGTALSYRAKRGRLCCHILRHCERSEAIRSASAAAVRIASSQRLLAMTRLERYPP